MNAKPDSIHAATMDGAKTYQGISFVNARMAMNPTLMVIIVGISTNALVKMMKFVLRQVIEKMISLHFQSKYYIVLLRGSSFDFHGFRKVSQYAPIFHLHVPGWLQAFSEWSHVPRCQ